MLIAAHDAVATLIDLLSEGKSAKFASVTYRAKETRELARHMLILNFEVESLYQKDIDTLTAVKTDPASVELFAQELGFSLSTTKIALNKVLESLKTSLAVGVGHHPDYVHSPENADTYVHMLGVRGVRVHKDSGETYILGFTQGKKVLEAGEYHERHSGELVRCKNAVKMMLGCSKIRLFIIRRIRRAALNGEVLEIEAED